MIRLGIAVEGKTEVEFVNSVLVQHFIELDITAFALPVGRQISHKSVGGNISIPRLSHQMSLLYWSSEYVTSFVDFYGFVRKGTMSVDQLEKQLKKEVRKRVRHNWDSRKVIPYVQMHEFESLLFSDVSKFNSIRKFKGYDTTPLQNIRDSFKTPEDINDSKMTAPSSRLKLLLDGFDKNVDGPEVAKLIGIAKMREECPRFNEWLEQLEALGS